MKELKATLPLILLSLSSNLAANTHDEIFSLTLEQLSNAVVTTTSKYKEYERDAAGNILVITREEINQRGYKNLDDLLIALPGIDIQDYTWFTSKNIFTFRGHNGNNKFLILQDGIRISTAGGETTSIAENYPLYYAKQVEILMGPASAIYGADAFLGVINVITLGESDREETSLNLSIGDNSFKEGNMLLSKQVKNHYRINMGLSGFHSQNLDFAKNFPSLYTPGAASPVGNPIAFAPNTAHTATLNIKYKDIWSAGAYYSEFESSTDLGDSTEFSAFNTQAKSLAMNTSVYGKYQQQFSTNLRGTTTLTLMEYEVGNKSNFNNLFSGFSPAYKYAQTQRISVSEDFQYSGLQQHQISIGAVYDYINTIPLGPDLVTPYNTSRSSTQQNLLHANTSLKVEFFEQDYENAGIYVQDNWNLGNKWHLISGVRYDSNSLYGDSTNPRASLIYQPSDNDVLKILYGESFLAPAPDFLFKNFGFFDGTTNSKGEWVSPFYHVPNPNLKPERLKTLEVTYDHHFQSGLNVKFAPYLTKIDDAIERHVDPSPLQRIPGAELQGTQSFSNTGQLTIFGIDISASKSFHYNALEIKNWLNLSLINGNKKESGTKSELPLIAPVKLKGGAIFNFHQELIVTPSFTWVSKTNHNDFDPNNPKKRTKTPSYFIINTHTEWQATTSLSLLLNIHNILDKRITHANLGPSSGTSVATRAQLPETPQPGRLISIAMNYTF